MFKLTPTSSREIDSQHQCLIDWMNHMHDQIQKGVPKEDLIIILDSLLYYSETHFAYEEKGMAHFCYPETNLHIIQHQGFIIKIRELKERISEDSSLAVTEILTYLRKWLLAHIEKDDFKYIQFMEEKMAPLALLVKK